MAINPEWQTRIREELNDIEVPSDGPYQIPQWTSISNLEVLDAVMKKALRLHSAAPASVWREVPESGLVLGGNFIPQKGLAPFIANTQTVVSMQCYTTHRDPGAFPDAEKFNPFSMVKQGPTSRCNE
jgi:cytochrome P450